MLDAIIERYKDHSIALTGCRADKINYECCEYNLIILDAKEELIKIDNEYFLIHNLSNHKIQRYPQLYNAIIIQDPSLRLITLDDNIKPSIVRDAKTLLVDALLDASYAKHASNLLEASYMLKRSAYRYANALLELNDIRPAPLHIYPQLKELGIDLTLILECLDIKQVNRSTIDRALSMLTNLPYYELIKHKVSYLYDKYKYVDCYFYILHLGMKLDNYTFDRLKVILNLSTDDYIRRLAIELIDECKLCLRNINH